MNVRKTIVLLSALLCILLTSSAAAMSSTSYRLDWFTPLTGSGGPASSPNYAINFTVGQTAIGASSSASYGVGLGYWYGAVVQYKVFLPIVLRQ